MSQHTIARIILRPRENPKTSHPRNAAHIRIDSPADFRVLTWTEYTNVLDKQFDGLIDMSDFTKRPAEQQRAKFLTRALAALCIKNLAHTDAATAAGSVTDDFIDGGLDTIHFDQVSDTLILVQAKWNQDGDKPIDASSCMTFVSGVQDLLGGKFERFNARVRKKEAEVRSVLWAERPVRIRLVTVHTAAQPTHTYVKRTIEDFVEQLNDAVQVASADFFDQAAVYGLITSESKPAQIKLQFGLRDWGHIDRPYLAYYGRAHINDVHDWWHKHGNALFSENLRVYYPSSDVNNALRSTLDTSPEDFWYFNNGITIICASVSTTLHSAPGRRFGVFTCDGVSVVNGAQTVGTIGVAGSLPVTVTDDELSNPQPWVQIRIISLERCPPDFSRRITRAANLQNAVGSREFAAMDPQQQRLATDFALDRRKYVYKSGEPDPKGDEGCGIVEATQALACAISVGLAVQAKREIGLIWANTEGPPYTELFHEKVTSTRVWRSVLVLRTVDDELQKFRTHEAARADMIAIHMNRVILHLVFQDPELKHRAFEEGLERDLVIAARGAAMPVFLKVSDYLEEHHPGDYLASLSKNSGKCEAMVRILREPLLGPDPEKQPDLFS